MKSSGLIALFVALGLFVLWRQGATPDLPVEIQQRLLEAEIGSAVPALIEALEAGSTPIAAANAIARMGDERGVEPIVNVASNPQLRLWMVMALGELNRPDTISALIKALGDESQDVRGRAAAALIRFGDVALPGLRQLAMSASVQTRLYATAILGYVGGPGEIPLLQTMCRRPLPGDLLS